MLSEHLGGVCTPHGLQEGGEADEHLALPRWQLLITCSMPSVNFDLSGSWLSCTLKRKGMCRKGGVQDGMFFLNQLPTLFILSNLAVQAI